MFSRLLGNDMAPKRPSFDKCLGRVARCLTCLRLSTVGDWKPEVHRFRESKETELAPELPQPAFGSVSTTNFPRRGRKFSGTPSRDGDTFVPAIKERIQASAELWRATTNDARRIYKVDPSFHAWRQIFLARWRGRGLIAIRPCYCSPSVGRALAPSVAPAGHQLERPGCLLCVGSGARKVAI